MALNIPRLIWLFQILLLLGGQFLTFRVQRLIHPFNTAEANNRTGDPFIDPRQSNVAHLPAILLGQLLDAFDYELIALRLTRGEHSRRLRRTGRRTSDRQRSREIPSRQRRPRDQANAGLIAEVVHLAFLFSIQEAVMILHGDEFRPATLLGAELHLRELVCPHAGGADIEDFAHSDEIVQGFHCLFDWSVGIEAMDLK